MTAAAAGAGAAAGLRWGRPFRDRSGRPWRARPDAPWWDRPGYALLLVLLMAVPLLGPDVPPLVDLPGHMGRYRVQLDAGHEIVAYTAGKMKKNRIKTLAGDRVTVEMSPYDLEKGRLIFRHKDTSGPTGPRPNRPTFRRR